MEKQDKEILRKNRVFLLDNIASLDRLLSELLAADMPIVNDSMVASIQSNRTRERKIGALLDLLPRRGPTAFSTFCTSLRRTDQGFIADRLEGTGEMTGVEKNMETLTVSVPPEEAVAEKGEVEPCMQAFSQEKPRVIHKGKDERQLQPTDKHTSGRSETSLSRYLNSPSAAEALGTRTIRFDPGTSYAVVAGVSQQLCLEEAGLTNLGTTADSDADLISSILAGSFKIPSNQVTVLNSCTQHATTSNINTALASSSKVGEHGALVFYFSGHCVQTKRDDILVLAPADFKRSTNTAITPGDIAKAVRSCTGSIILILDCCYAGMFAERLIDEAERSGLKVCVLASCTAEEKSLSHNELGNCFFTYFLAKFLQDVDRNTTEGTTLAFPAEGSVEYCRPLCEAILSLMRPGYGDSAKMTPGVTFSTMCLQTAGTDVVDGRQSRAFDALKYLSHNENEDLPEVPSSVRRWLDEDASAALAVLNRAGVLDRSEVYATVLGMMSQSMAQIMFEDNLSPTSNRSILLQADLFIFCFFRLSEVLLPINQNMELDLFYMKHCLVHYMKKVRDLTQADAKGEEFRDFINLFHHVVNDLKRQAGTDTIDGLEADPTVDDIIRSLPPSEAERIFAVELLV